MISTIWKDITLQDAWKEEVKVVDQDAFESLVSEPFEAVELNENGEPFRIYSENHVVIVASMFDVESLVPIPRNWKNRSGKILLKKHEVFNSQTIYPAKWAECVNRAKMLRYEYLSFNGSVFHVDQPLDHSKRICDVEELV